MDRTVVQLVHLDNTGDSCYRMRWPGRDLAAQDSSLRVINLQADARERFEYGLECDLLVLYQSHDVDLFPLLRARRAMGRKTLVEYNDNFYDPPWASPVSAHWRSPLVWQIYERFMREADGVVVTGTGLRELFSSQVEVPFHILQNHLPFEPQSFKELFSPVTGEFHLGWAGSVGHVPDLLAIAPAIRELMRRYPNVIFHLMGNEALPPLLRLPPARLRFTLWGSMEEYYKFWQPIHAGIAPLCDTPYNRCRSDVKAVEMAAHGVLPILSPLEPYKPFIQETGAPTFLRQSDLLDTIGALIADRTALRAKAARAHDYVVRKRVGSRRTERLDLYRSYLGEEAVHMWDLAPGYHELKGTTDRQSESAEILKETERLLKSGLREKAETFLQEALAKNPLNVEIAVLLISVIDRGGDRTRARAQLADAMNNYPHDPRLQVLAIVLEDDAAKQAHHLARFMALIEKLGPHYREFCYPEIARRVLPLLKTKAEYFVLLEQLGEFYSEGAELRYLLAEGYLQRDESERAAEHFEWLWQQKFSLHRNSRFLQSIQDNYLPAMAQGSRAASEKKG